MRRKGIIKYNFVPNIYKNMDIKRKEGNVSISNICPVCGFDVDKSDKCSDGSHPSFTLFMNGMWTHTLCHKKCFYILIKGSAEIIDHYGKEYMLEAL